MNCQVDAIEELHSVLRNGTNDGRTCDWDHDSDGRSVNEDMEWCGSMVGFGSVGSIAWSMAFVEGLNPDEAL
jgi:hypothetical protein